MIIEDGFSVCAMCKEEENIVRRFIDYYLSQGAYEIKIYLDEGAQEFEHDNSRVKIIRCRDVLFSVGLQKRPPYVEQMQRIIYQDAFDALLSRWLLICDIDEFVAGYQSIDHALVHVPTDWHYLQIPVAEAVWGPGDDISVEFGCTHFRTRAVKGFGKIQSRLIYGSYGRFTVAGLVGHNEGKYFIRNDAPVKALGLHTANGEALIGGNSRNVKPIRNLYLYHFDAINRSRWELKWQGRIDKSRQSAGIGYNKAHRDLIDKFKAAKSPHDKIRLFYSLYSINKVQRLLLILLHQLHRREFW